MVVLSFFLRPIADRDLARCSVLSAAGLTQRGKFGVYCHLLTLIQIPPMPDPDRSSLVRGVQKLAQDPFWPFSGLQI